MSILILQPLSSPQIIMTKPKLSVAYGVARYHRMY